MLKNKNVSKPTINLCCQITKLEKEYNLKVIKGLATLPENQGRWQIPPSPSPSSQLQDPYTFLEEACTQGWNPNFWRCCPRERTQMAWLWYLMELAFMSPIGWLQNSRSLTGTEAPPPSTWVECRGSRNKRPPPRLSLEGPELHTFQLLPEDPASNQPASRCWPWCFPLGH